MNIKPILHNNREGYALYLVLIVLSLLGVLFSVVILSLRNTANTTQADLKKFQARLLAQSGAARTEYFLNGGDGHSMQWETDSLNETYENVGRIKIICKHFGAYAKLECTGIYRNAQCAITSLAGRDVPEALKPTLTLTEDINGLVFDQTSVIQGMIVLDYGDIVKRNEKGNLNGIDASVVQKIVRKSPALPFAPGPLDSVFSSLKSYRELPHNNALTTYGGNLVVTHANDSLLRNGLLEVQGDCEMSQVRITGKTIVVSGALFIGENAECKVCTFIAKKLDITSGTTDKCLFYTPERQKISGGNHDAQFFCEDSICVGQNAHFYGTSTWVSRKSLEKKTKNHGGIFFAERGNYLGCALCYNDTLERTKFKFQGTSIVLGGKSSFTGFIITDGDFELGDVAIEGQIWAMKVIGRKDNQIKINEIAPVSIKPLSRDIPFPLLGAPPISVRNYYIGTEYEINR